MFKTLLELSKVKITFAVSLTTIAGYGLAYGQFSERMILPTIGLFLIACASAALNQYQERRTDAIMDRTKNRPIPSGRISAENALIYIISLSLVGAALIYFSSNLTAVILAFLAMLWYNGIYTPLKKKSAFAVIPGSVIGAIPPMVGWAAAGGDVFSTKLFLLAFFFFIWQIPHFWLLLMKYGPDYEKAGFPSLTSIYTDDQLKRITFIWTVATAISALFIPYFNISNTLFAFVAIASLSVVFILMFSGLLKSSKAMNRRKYFMYINFFLLSVLISLYIDILV